MGDDDKNEKDVRFDKLVLSGGSTQAFAFIGAARLLEERGLMRHVRVVAGSSAGALVAFMLVLGMSADEIHSWASERVCDARANALDLDDVLDMFNAMGIDKGARARGFLAQLLAHRHTREELPRPEALTFARLLELHPERELRVCAADLTTSAPVYFSARTHPQVPVLLALHASMSLPLLYAPVELDGHLLADGGLFENLPVRCVLTDPPPERPICGSSSPAEPSDSTASTASKAPSQPDVLAINVPWDVLHTLPRDLVQYALYLMTSLLRRANNVGADGAPSLSRDESARVRVVHVRDKQKKQSAEASSPFLGFCFESLEFSMDTALVTRYESLGRAALARVLDSAA